MKNLDVNKIKQVALYFSEKVSDLYSTKMLKLFYYFDFISVLESGKPATNDVYYHLPYGPVPSFIKDQITLLKEEIRGGEEEVMKCEDGTTLYPVKSAFFDILELEEKGGGFILKKKGDTSPDMAYLSEYEKSLLDDIILEFKDSKASDLSRKTHSEVPYSQTIEGSIIDYKMAFHLKRDEILPMRTYAFSPEISQSEFFSA